MIKKFLNSLIISSLIVIIHGCIYVDTNTIYEVNTCGTTKKQEVKLNSFLKFILDNYISAVCTNQQENFFICISIGSRFETEVIFIYECSPVFDYSGCDYISTYKNINVKIYGNNDFLFSKTNKYRDCEYCVDDDLVLCTSDIETWAIYFNEKNEIIKTEVMSTYSNIDSIVEKYYNIRNFFQCNLWKKNYLVFERKKPKFYCFFSDTT